MKPRSCWIVVLLLVLHQDYWNWTSETLWFGFLPVQLGYHIILSLVTAACWLWIVRHDWPLAGSSEETADAGETA